jgi:hypothetical protein
MSTKTVSLREDAYERLRSARRHPSESFSEVVLRARWPDEGITAAELLELYEREGPFLTPVELDAIEDARKKDRPPLDKWKRR